jgi:hypothetical protein
MRHDVLLCDVIRSTLILHDIIRYDVLLCDVRHDVILYDVIRCGVVL